MNDQGSRVGGSVRRGRRHSVHSDLAAGAQAPDQHISISTYINIFGATQAPRLILFFFIKPIDYCRKGSRK